MNGKSKIILGLLLLALALAIGFTQDSNLDADTAISVARLSLKSTDLPTLNLLSDAQVSALISELDATPTIPAAALPRSGTFWSLANPSWPPLPGNFNGLPSWPIDDGTAFLLNDLDFDYAASTSPPMMRRAMSMGVPGFDDVDEDDSGSDTNRGTFCFNHDSLWLEITNVADGFVYLNLHHATNQVYEIWSKSDLTLTNWNIEMALWPTNPAVMPFIVPELSRTNLFVWARDWTSLTANGNATPEWWFWKYFGRVALSDTNLDSRGITLLHDYTNNLDPNLINFYFDLPPRPVISNTVTSTINIFRGVPSYMAILVNDTNLTDAVWQTYSSNIVVSLNSGNGVYNVLVGLRGLPLDAMQTWQSNRVTLYAVSPVLTITNPVSTTVSAPMIQLQGWVNEALSSLTFDVSNASGIFTNQIGYWQAAFYDTHLLAFTTNSFQCYDVALTNGLNIITFHATDLAGNRTTTNFSYTVSYAGVTNPPVLSVLWPTNGTLISGSNFTMQAQVSDATATVTATINSNTVQGLVERSGAVWFDDLPLAAGTNLLTVTATGAAGNATTTNLALIQGSVLVTLDPLASDWFNQTNVSVTGTVSDTNASYDLYVNGVAAYYTDDEGGWEADGVAASATGTATFNVEIYAAGSVRAPVVSAWCSLPSSV